MSQDWTRDEAATNTRPTPAPVGEQAVGDDLTHGDVYASLLDQLAGARAEAQRLSAELEACRDRKSVS